MSSLTELLAGHGDPSAFASAPPDYIESAPKEVRNRVKALKQLQLASIDVQAEFSQKLHELDCQFRAKFDALNNKRAEIVAGDYEPGENEATEPIFSYMSEEDAKNFDDSAPVSGGEQKKGIPEFWFQVLHNAPGIGEFITEDDEPILKYITDVKVALNANPAGFVLTFEFAENPYFKNKVLTKEYTMSIGPNGFEKKIMYDGPSIVACKGCTIQWNEGKNVTQKVMKKKQKKGDNAGRYVTKTVDNESFFQFFTPKITQIVKDMNDEEAELLNADFEAGQALRDSVVDSAVLYYTGELADDDDDIFEDDDGDAEDDEEDE